VIAPVDGFSVRVEGKEPLAMLQVSAPVPPEPVSV